MIEYYRFLVVGAQEFQTKARASAGLRGLFRNDELEMMAETKSNIGENIPSSWLFKLVYYMSQQAACSGQLKYYLEQYGVTTMELIASEAGLEQFQNEQGMVGVMLGVEHPDLPKKVKFPGGNIILTTIKILTPEELKYVVEYRAEGRNTLHNLFKQTQTYHFCEPNRRSLITAANKSLKPAHFVRWTVYKLRFCGLLRKIFHKTAT